MCWVGVYPRSMAVLHYQYGRLLCFTTGFYFPLFYLQLDSVQHKNSETFSFYSVRHLLLPSGLLNTDRSVTCLVGTFEWGKLDRSIVYRIHCNLRLRAQANDHSDRHMWCSYSRHDRPGPHPDGRGAGDDLWLFCWHMSVYFHFPFRRVGRLN